MKKLLLAFFILIGATAVAQQKGIGYQAMIINPSEIGAPGYNAVGTPLANKSVCMQFQILNAASQVEYQETQTLSTDQFGMVNLVIGTGNKTGGTATSLATITWGLENKTLVVGVNTKGTCSNYNEISKQVLNYVPYAMYAEESNVKDGVITTAKLADGSVTDAKVATGISKSKVGLSNADNTSDALKPISTATQTALNLKEDLSNKSTATTLGMSDVLYPSQNAVKAYVDAQVIAAGDVPDASATAKGKLQLAGDLTGTAEAPVVAPAAITTAKLADASVTDAKINAVSGSKVTGNIDGNAATATKLATARNINGIAFDGGADITVTTPAVTLTGNTLSPTVTGSSLTSVGTLTNLTVTNPIAGSITGNAATATAAGSVTTNANLTGPVTSVGNATAIANGAISNAMLANAAVANLTGTNTGDQTATTVVNVAAGTIAAVTVQGALNELDTEKAGLASPTFTGTVTAQTFVGALTGNATTATTAGSVTTNANLTGEVTSVGNAATVTNIAVIEKVLTGYTSAAGTVTAADNILQAIQKLDGNDALKAPVASPTFTGSVSVNGVATNATAFNADASTTIDFTRSNLTYTSNSPGAFILSGIKDGGTYTLAVQGTTAGTSTFSSTSFAFKSVNNGVTVAGKETLYTFIVMSNSVYFFMTTGF